MLPVCFFYGREKIRSVPLTQTSKSCKVRYSGVGCGFFKILGLPEKRSKYPYEEATKFKL